MTIDGAGNLYGTSEEGGHFGLGTVFKVNKAGVLSVVHNFGALGDGWGPTTGVARDKAGNLYGGTRGGPEGEGVVYKLTPSGTETLLFVNPEGSDVGVPGSVSLDAGGNVFGITNVWIFEIDETQRDPFLQLYLFCSLPGCADGAGPTGKMVLDRAGNFYGSTAEGGDTNNGVIFEFTPSSGVEMVLHSFTGTDGTSPSDLKQDAVGNLYGVTLTGGLHSLGTLFKLPEAGGPLTTLYNFCSRPGCRDGQLPIGPVQLDKAGNIYGVTIQGNSNSGGVVWEVNTAGKEIVLHTFPVNEGPFAGLTIDSDGNLYGITFSGGANQLGSVFKLTLVK
jgi:uncharacterized repeat protein (TIGR03803 family)